MREDFTAECPDCGDLTDHEWVDDEHVQCSWCELVTHRP
ncbi:hypothetical protein PQD13_gp04 [Gordonia phage Clawz]|uniref:Uncharacterized protein n=1 Tax=Gordonia phage Clawz TaxID=2743910 RepID=A0AAE7F7Z2_9CAUD|nr:hypothetical protein PQD13_gp04 [Gordonia phage Clawz]QKY79916.1 hypothetical protein SEA_CLAWZ_4 [Gordonia phage Clawz]